jgi:threonine dehydratase
LNVETLVREAAERIRGHVRETPLERSFALSERSGRNVHLKLENVQIGGSFKVRGVLNFLFSLSPAELERGVITASTGNHGLGLAYGAGLVGTSCVVCLPEGTPAHRVEALRRLGPELLVAGSECAETEAFAREEAAARGLVYVPPYNDTRIVGGHGTIGLELLEELGRVDRVFVAVGGGGLISGIGGFLKDAAGATTVVGCLPKNSPVMYDSVLAGRIVDSTVMPTLSDATAGGIEPGAITFALCREYVDDWILVEEDEIAAAMRFVFDEHRIVIEGAAGVAVAGFLQQVEPVTEARSGIAAGAGRASNDVVLLCGGNVDPTLFREIVCGDRGGTARSGGDGR